MTIESNQSQTSANQANPRNLGNQSIDRLAEAGQIVSRNWKWASGVGVVPIPLVDIIGVTTVQLKMLKELCDLYQVRFTKNLGKSAIGTLIGGLFSGIGTVSLVSLAKLIPVVGTTVGVLAQPVVFGATTYALGNIFIQHFETGGNLLNFDAQGMRRHFQDQYEAGKLVVEQNLGR